MDGRITKQKIIETAIKLFNLYGTQNVRLQQIADETGISVGNLAYHFHDKKKILRQCVLVVDSAFEETSVGWKQLDRFIDFDNQLSRYYNFLNTYSFYFLDSVDIQRYFPEMYKGILTQMEIFVNDLTHWLGQCASEGLILEEKRKDQFADISKMIWYIGTFWMSKKRLLEEKEDFELGFKKLIWQQLEPFLSTNGYFEFDLMIAPALYV